MNILDFRGLIWHLILISNHFMTLEMKKYTETTLEPTTSLSQAKNRVRFNNRGHLLEYRSIFFLFSAQSDNFIFIFGFKTNKLNGFMTKYMMFWYLLCTCNMFQNYLTNYIGLRPILVEYHSSPVHCYIIFCKYIYVLIKRGKMPQWEMVLKEIWF